MEFVTCNWCTFWNFVKSTRASKKMFKFDMNELKKEPKEMKNNDDDMDLEPEEEIKDAFEVCTVEVVEKWDYNQVGDYVNWLFREKEYDSCRDQYVAIFMNLMIDGKQFMKLQRKQISHMGIVTKKGKRHVSVIRNAQRHITQRSAK